MRASHPVRLTITLGIIVAAAAAACAPRVPQAPEPLPPPEVLKVDSVRQEEPLPPLPAPEPLAPRVRWAPAIPSEGTLVSLIIEERPRSLPLLELWVRAGEEPIRLARLRDGAYLALVPAPIGVREIPLEITTLFVDGARLQERLTLTVDAREFPATRLTVARRYTAPDEATLRRIRREQQRVRSMLSTIGETALWQGPFDRPVEGGTTAPYGQRRMFNGELRSRHTGLDLRGATGDPIRAANSGRVALSDDLFFNGGAVFIDHGLGVYTGYFHMSRRDVEEGEWVERGQVIGRVGATGRVTGPHLHWSLYVLGRSLDPLSLLDPQFIEVADRLPPPPLARVPWLPETATADEGCENRICN